MPSRRAGSPFTGLGPVFMKELSDHLSSIRMLVLTLFVIVFGALPVGFALQDLRNVVVSDPYLFLRIFTVTPERVGLSFILALNFIIPLMAIGLGFDSVNSEFNRRTLSRVLSQPIYRDALLLGKFLGGARHACRGAGGAVADRAGRRGCCCSACRRAASRWRAASASWSWPSPMAACGSRWRCCSR